MLRRRDMLKMLMRPINDVEGNALRDSDDNDDDEVKFSPFIFFTFSGKVGLVQAPDFLQNLNPVIAGKFRRAFYVYLRRSFLLKLA